MIVRVLQPVSRQNVDRAEWHGSSRWAVCESISPGFRPVTWRGLDLQPSGVGLDAGFSRCFHELSDVPKLSCPEALAVGWPSFSSLHKHLILHGPRRFELRRALCAVQHEQAGLKMWPCHSLGSHT